MGTLDEEEPRVLFTRHVAARWSRLAGAEISPRTASSYWRKSRPGGRYHTDGDPMPEAQQDGRRLYWYPEQGPDLDAWWLRRRGRIGDPRSVGDRDARGKRT